MCNFTAQKIWDDLFFILFHIISAIYFTFGIALYNPFPILPIDGIYNKV